MEKRVNFKEEGAMSVEANKKLVSAFYEAIGGEDYDALHKFCHEDFVFYPQINTPFPGVEGLVESEKKNFDAFSDFTFAINELIAEKDLVAAYMEFMGTHTGTFCGIEPTYKKVHFSLMMFLRIKDSKIIEKRSHVDVNDVITQLKK